uniref:TERF1 (TRF1)-interacting nuclear factor 2 n=1 Tax=Neolamprologus brichardi TaxID=32507 RepID=A0A3Q4I9D5_NEOBR
GGRREKQVSSSLKKDARLPFAALQLLAPPVRLVSAALWKVLKRRDVMQYGVVEEFVTSSCEAVPGLLTVRHQGRLTVGLRARVSITGEGKSDLNVCLNHCTVSKNDHTAIFDNFYSEKLLWEFLVRLDQLLPVPNLVQTVAWLSDAPPVLEECARAATQPQLLKILLQHETCLGHLQSAASLPPNMGDSILASLSLPPSGRVPSDQPTAARKLSVDESEGAEPKSKPSFIAPVIGLISNEDVPRSDGPADNAGHEQLNSKFTSVKQRPKAKDKGAKEGREQLEEGCTLSQRNGVKRKNSDRGESDLEEEEVLSVTTPVEKRLSGQTQSKGDQRRKEGRAETIRKEGCSREVLAARMRKLGVRTLYHPEDQHLYSVFVDCLIMEPRVVIEEMSAASLRASTSGTEETSSYQCFESLCLPQLFMKRYYKTKHGTYVPTLREFWKPAMTRRRLLSAGHKRR